MRIIKWLSAVPLLLLFMLVATSVFACPPGYIGQPQIDLSRSCIQTPCNSSVWAQYIVYTYPDSTTCSEPFFYSNSSCTQPRSDPQCLLQRPNCFPGECGGNGICTNTQLLSNNQICSNNPQYITPPTCGENDTNCQALAANADWCQEVTCGSQCNKTITRASCDTVYARQGINVIDNSNAGHNQLWQCSKDTSSQYYCGIPAETPVPPPPTATPTPAPKGCYQDCTNSTECGKAADGAGLVCDYRPGTTNKVCLRYNNPSDPLCRPLVVNNPTATPTLTPTATPTSAPLCGSGCSVVDGGGPRTCTPTAGLTNNNYLYINNDPLSYAAGHCGTGCYACPAGTSPSTDHCGCVTPTPACSGNSLCGSGGICAGSGAGGEPAFNSGCNPGCSGNWVYTSGGDNQCNGVNPYCFTCTAPPPSGGGSPTSCAGGGGYCAGAGAGGGPAFSGSTPSCGGYWSYYGLDTCPQGGAIPYCFICILPQATPTRIPTITPTPKPFLQTSGGSVHGQN